MMKVKKYQHLRCTLWISVAAIIVLIVSLNVPCTPWDSILQNIFAGLVTGIVVTLISSLKSKEIKDAEIEAQFMKMVNDLYIYSRREYLHYRECRHDKDDVYSEATYELITELQAIESFLEAKDKDDRLVRILGKKPSEYFDEENYSFEEQKKRHGELYKRLDSELQYDEEERKVIDHLIETIRSAHRSVNRKAMRRIDEILDEKIEIETSIP